MIKFIKKIIVFVKDLMSTDPSTSSAIKFVMLFAVVDVVIMWDVANIAAWIQALKEHWKIGLLDFTPLAVGIVMTVITGKVVQKSIETKCPDQTGGDNAQQN